MPELLTVGFSTRNHNQNFIDYLKKTSGFKKINVIEKINTGEKSLSKIYNEILGPKFWRSKNQCKSTLKNFYRIGSKIAYIWTGPLRKC